MDGVVDGREGAEELVGDVGEDRRAAHGDAILHHEEEQLAEKGVELLCGVELGELRGEFPGKIDVHRLLDLGLQAGVTETQATRTERVQAALTAVPGAALAASRRGWSGWGSVYFIGAVRVGCLRIHFFCPLVV